MTAQTRLPAYFNCIDAIRVLAALAVVIFHYHHFYLADYAARAEVPPTASFPFAGALWPFYRYGFKAVELFWIISGFVFTHVYLQTPTTFYRFAVARFARLYPLHFATLIGVAVLQVASLHWAGHWQVYGNNDLRHFLVQLIMGSHWSTFATGLSFNGPIWSVSLEIGAYFFFICTLPLIRRFRLPAAVALAALAWWIGTWHWTTLRPIQPAVFTCAGYFFTGVVLFFLYAAAVGRGRGALPGLIAACVLAGAVLAANGQGGWSDIAFGAALILLAGLCDLHVGRAGGWLRSAGNLSYALYLVHVPLQMAVLLVADLALGGRRDFADHPLTLPLYLAASLVLAWAVFAWFEHPAGRALRRRLLPQARRAG